jgi:hypothetical protein
MLEAIEKAAREAGVAFRGLNKGSSDNPESFFESAHIATSTKTGDSRPTMPSASSPARHGGSGGRTSSRPSSSCSSTRPDRWT